MIDGTAALSQWWVKSAESNQIWLQRNACLQPCSLISLHLDKKAFLWVQIPTVSNLPTAVLIAFFFPLWNYFRGIILLCSALEQSFSYIFSYILSRSRTTVLKIRVLGPKYLVNYLLFGHKLPLLTLWLEVFFLHHCSKLPLDTDLIIVVTYSKIEIKIQWLICSTLLLSFASLYLFIFSFRADSSVCPSVAETKTKRQIVKIKATQWSLYSFLTRTVFRG